MGCEQALHVFERSGAERSLEALAPVGALRPMEPRVRTVLDWLDGLESEGRWREVTLEAALRQVHLSPSRFRHLFSEALGTPWRSSLVWRRALVALRLAAGGASLTEAAHLSGYADSAHLSRQFRALFGWTLASFLQNSHFVQVTER